MPILNFTPPSYRILVGGVDFASCVQSFSISRPIADISTPYSWSGSITFAVPLERVYLPESLDDLVNPSRWAKGVHPVQIWFQITGTYQLFCTLRILEYFFDDQTLTGEATVGDILSLLDYRQPAKNYAGLSFAPCSPVTVNAIAQKALTEAGVPHHAVNVSGSIAVPPNKPNGASWIKWAQSYLGERGYWLYVDKTEVVRAAQYPTIAPGVNLFVKSKLEIEAFTRQRSPDVPHEKIIVTASPEKFTTCGTEGTDAEFPEEQFGNIKLADGSEVYTLERRITNNLVASTNTHKITEQIVEQAMGSVFPEDFAGNTSMMIAERSKIKTNYNQKGQVTLIETTTARPLAVLFPDVFSPLQFAFLADNIEIINEEFNSLDSTNVINQRIKTTWGASLMGVQAGTYTGTFGTGTQNITVPYGPDFVVTIQEKVEETWKANAPVNPILPANECVCATYQYRKKVYARDATKEGEQTLGNSVAAPAWILGAFMLKSKQGKLRDNSPPPEWQVRSPTCPTCTDNVIGEAVQLPVGYTPYRERELEISASTVQTVTEANYLANLIGDLAWQRYWQRSISMPMPHQFVLDSRPFHRIDVHNGAFVIDNPTLSFGDDGLEFSCVGNYLGEIPVVNAPVEADVVYAVI